MKPSRNRMEAASENGPLGVKEAAVKVGLPGQSERSPQGDQSMGVADSSPGGHRPESVERPVRPRRRPARLWFAWPLPQPRRHSNAGTSSVNVPASASSSAATPNGMVSAPSPCPKPNSSATGTPSGPSRSRSTA